MNKRITGFSTGILVLLLTACSPELSITVNSDQSSRIAFKTGFSAGAAATLRSITGSPENDTPLFTPAEIISVFKNAGLQQITATAPDINSLSAAGTCPPETAGTFAATGMLIRANHTSSFVIGPSELQKFYATLNQEGQGYIDLLMAPVFTGEKMSAAEYKDLLSSVYGPSFASELTTGVITISLTAPGGKQTVQKKLTLGELLTLTDTKTLTVAW
jgi:hypothetical protein